MSNVFLFYLGVKVVEIKAFQGYRYNSAKVDIQNVIMPPYDVIDKDMKKKLTASKHNFIHINLNRSYDEANKILEQWIKDKILIKDNEESFYVYQQEFNVDGVNYKRTVFICLLKLEELGDNIMPHEQTFKKHVDERYGLMEKTKAHLGQIFMIYEDDKKDIDKILLGIVKNPEDIHYVDDDKCSHKIWKFNDTKIISNIINLMKDKKTIIADGHHRYKTSLRYYQNHQDIEGSKYVMVTLVNSYNEGLIILPANRLLKETEINIDDFSQYFDIENLDNLENIKLEDKSFIIAKENKCYLLRLKDQSILDVIFKGGDAIYKDLDVLILQKLIFEKIINLPPEELNQKIDFVKGNKSTINSLSYEKSAFFVKPPSLQQIFEIAKKGKVMPQKSTYFYPKMFSGLVIHKF